MRILVIDIGGTHVKLLASGRRRPIQIDSGPEMTPRKMVRLVRAATRDWKYDAVSIGYPGPVRHGRVAGEPKHLGSGWRRFNFARAFGKPVRLRNDAAMQALGSYRGGRMLFLGFGTGLGTTLIADGVVVPMELAHLYYRKARSFEDYVGKAGLRKFGKKKWRRNALDVIDRLRHTFLVDHVVVGGGNAKLLTTLPKGVRRGGNELAFAGGYAMWADRRLARPTPRARRAVAKARRA